MMSDAPVFYLRALLGSPGALYELPFGDARQVSLVAHFYVQAEGQPEAGAWAHDWCRFHGLTFDEYICLPNVISLEQVKGETEHEQALELARQEGEAVVISVVLGVPAPPQRAE
jgi:hypothetical protein